MSIGTQSKKESVEFMNTLNDMLEIIDGVSLLISDNNYLQLCNGLKKLHDFQNKEDVVRYIEIVRERVRANPTVLSQAARAKMKTKSALENKSDAEKIKSGRYQVCPKCDRLVVKKSGLSSHQYTDVCKRTYETKKVTHKSPTLITDTLTELICRLRGIFLNYNGFKYYPKMIRLKLL